MVVTVGLLISNHYRFLSFLWKLPTMILVLSSRIESHVWIWMHIWLSLWNMIFIEELFNPSDVYSSSVWIRLTMTDLILGVGNWELIHYYILINLLTPMRRYNATFWSIVRLRLYVWILKAHLLHLLYQGTITSLLMAPVKSRIVKVWSCWIRTTACIDVKVKIPCWNFFIAKLMNEHIGRTYQFGQIFSPSWFRLFISLI